MSREIVDAVNALRKRYTLCSRPAASADARRRPDAPTSVAAFGVGISEHPRAIELLLTRIKPEDLNEARRRMARIPHGGPRRKPRVDRAGFS